MFHLNWRELAAICVAVACAVVPARVSAQTIGDNIPKVIVSGSRFSEAYDAGRPIGVTVISAADISASGATSIFDVMRRLGGLHTRSNLFGTGDDTIDLRGFGVTGDQNTLVLIDGQRVSENELQSARLSGVPLGSIERIEILRGSGAVLYGGGATSGVINVITKVAQPGSRNVNIGTLAGSYGSSDLRIDGGVAGALLALDFAANRFSTNNYRNNNAADQENISGRMRLVGEHGELALRIASERAHTRLPGALSAAQYAVDPRQAATPNDYADTDANHYSLFGTYRFAQADLALDVYRRDKVNRFYNDFGGGANQFTRSGSSVDGASPRVRVSAPLLGIDNQFVAGYDTARWSYRNQQAAFFPFFIGTPGQKSEADLGNANLSNDETGRQANDAWYFRNDVRAGPVRLSFGSRREMLYQSTDNPFAFLPLTEVRRKLHAEEVGVAWAIDPRWTVHGRVGNSFRVGNVDENRFRFPAPGFLEPQTSKDGEAGVTYASGSLDIDVRGFRHRLMNEIMFVPATFNNINLPPTERTGVELAVKWRPVASIDIAGFFTQVRARFRSGVFGGVDLAGKEVPVVPRDRTGISANWRFTANDAVNLGWQYVGSQIYDNDQANTFGRRVPAYATIDAKYTRRIGNVDISLIGTNLGNRGYFSYGVIGAGGASNVYPERRRGLFVNVAARF